MPVQTRSQTKKLAEQSVANKQPDVAVPKQPINNPFNAIVLNAKTNDTQLYNKLIKINDLGHELSTMKTLKYGLSPISQHVHIVRSRKSPMGSGVYVTFFDEHHNMLEGFIANLPDKYVGKIKSACIIRYAENNGVKYFDLMP